MIDKDEIKHVAVFSVRAGVRVLMDGLVTEESVGDGETVLSAEVKETDTRLVSGRRIAPRAENGAEGGAIIAGVGIEVTKNKEHVVGGDLEELLVETVVEGVMC